MTRARDIVAPHLARFPATKQRRMDALLEKNSEGVITARERVTLEKLVAEAEQLMVANAQRLVQFSTSARAGVPSQAVPVTVWVAPATAGR